MAHDHEDVHDDGGSGAASLLRLLPAAVLLVILVVFATANSQKTTVDFLVTETEAPLALVLLVTAVAGALIASLVKFQRRHR